MLTYSLADIHHVKEQMKHRQQRGQNRNDSRAGTVCMQVLSECITLLRGTCLQMVSARLFGVLLFPNIDIAIGLLRKVNTNAYAGSNE